MFPMNSILCSVGLVTLVSLGGCAGAPSTAEAPTELNESDSMDPGLGEHVDGSLEFKRQNGSTVELADLYEDRPIVLTFYRGNWCPYCQRALKEWQTRTDDLNEAGGRLVAVSLENLRELENTKEDLGLSYTVLSDHNGEAADYFDIAFDLDENTVARYKGFGVDLASANATDEWELPVPATYVIDTDGVIRYVYEDPNYQVRADPDAVIVVVESLN